MALQQQYVKHNTKGSARCRLATANDLTGKRVHRNNQSKLFPIDPAEPTQPFWFTPHSAQPDDMIKLHSWETTKSPAIQHPP